MQVGVILWVCILLFLFNLRNFKSVFVQMSKCMHAHVSLLTLNYRHPSCSHSARNRELSVNGKTCVTYWWWDGSISMNKFNLSIIKNYLFQTNQFRGLIFMSQESKIYYNVLVKIYVKSFDHTSTSVTQTSVNWRSRAVIPLTSVRWRGRFRSGVGLGSDNVI